MKHRSRLLTLLVLAAGLLPALPAPAQTSTAGSVRVLVEQSDGTYSEVRVTPTAGQVLGFDSAGKPTAVALPTVPAVPQIRAGRLAMPVTGGLTKAVTFSTPFPAGTSYAVALNAGGLVSNAWATSQSVNGFTLTLPLTVNGVVTYIATPLQ